MEGLNITKTKKQSIKTISLFSGIGGFEYGLQQSKHEFEIISFSEIDKYAISIYLRHFPNHKPLGDVSKINTKNLPDFDFLVGGFPCQAFSIAGKRKGFDDTRGTLFFEIARILKDKRPRYFLLENVKGLLSHDNGKTFQTILKVLSDLRYNVQWQVYNSKDYGVPQNRERVFIKGYSRDKCGPEVLLQRRINTSTDVKVSNTYYGTRSGRIHKPDEHMNTLTRTGQNSGGAQLIQLNNNKKRSQGARVYDSDGLAVTINAAGNNNYYRINKIGNVRKGHQGGDVMSTIGLSGTLCAQQYKDPPKIIQPVLTPDRKNKRQNGRHMKEDGEPMFTITASDRHGVYDGSTLRRLTPVECERLQGFPSGWTEFGKDGENISDTQRYKCTGNAVTTNVITAIVDDMFDRVSCDNTQFKSLKIHSILKRIIKIINPINTKTERLIYLISLVRVYNERNKRR